MNVLCSPFSLTDDVYDSDYIDEDEIEALLDEGFNTKKKASELGEQEYMIQEKTVLVGQYAFHS